MATLLTGQVLRDAGRSIRALCSIAGGHGIGKVSSIRSQKDSLQKVNCFNGIRDGLISLCSRFENASAAAEKAGMIDKTSVDIAIMLSNVKGVAKARARGNDLFSSGRFTEACTAYGEGLKYDKHNSVLYCNRAICWSKLGVWEKSIEDCNKALSIQPHYTKALLRRAVSYGKVNSYAHIGLPLPYFWCDLR